MYGFRYKHKKLLHIAHAQCWRQQLVVPLECPTRCSDFVVRLSCGYQYLPQNLYGLVEKIRRVNANVFIAYIIDEQQQREGDVR